MATTPTQTHPSSTLSKTQRRYTVGYVPGQGIHDTPSIPLRGEWLAEAGFPIGTGITVKIAGDCIVLIRDTDEVTGLRSELRQARQVIKQMKAGVLNALGDKA